MSLVIQDGTKEKLLCKNLLRLLRSWEENGQLCMRVTLTGEDCCKLSIYKDFLLATMDCSSSPGTEGMIDIDNESSEPAVL